MPWVNSYFSSSEVIKQRMDVCNACPELTSLKLCRDCGCIIPAKVRLKAASCPQYKWESVDDDGKKHFVEETEWSTQEAEAQKAKQQFR